MTYYLAIDIGASSGRHILGHIENGRLVLEEIYRFENSIKDIDGTLTWDIERLFREVKRGIARAHELGKKPKTVAIDTWGVDYVLLDERGEAILPVMCYRDPRGERGVMAASKIIGGEELYSRTGIQKQSFNTIYQLLCDKETGKIEGAKHFLMIPDYLAYRLTGAIRNEYTNATTTGLVNAKEREWDYPLIDRLGLPSRIFSPLSLTSECVGEFTENTAREVGYSATVLLAPTHDTASAVAGTPLDEGGVYISSGTWSLIGTECNEPSLTKEAFSANLTNEGGIEYRYRLLKNIMGMWLFQSIRRDIGKSLTYDEMMALAMESSYTKRFDPKDNAFLHPTSMLGAIRDYLGEPELPLSDVLSSVYHSLASSYREAILELEEITGKKLTSICIVGGGSRDTYLNSLTAEYTGKEVLFGITEATATGNLISQLMRDTGITLTEAREIIKNSFDIRRIKV